MASLFGTHYIWAIAGVQVLGLIGAVATRLGQGSRRQASCQGLFFALLVVVGLTTILNIAQEPGYWMASATTLSVMVLTATCDFGHARRELDGLRS
jgi:hypothetical protein